MWVSMHSAAVSHVTLSILHVNFLEETMQKNTKKQAIHVLYYIGYSSIR